jgi:hypothetical protein
LPGQKSPFDIAGEKNPQATKYEVQVQADPASEPTTKLNLLSANDRVDEIGYWHIAGEVANEGDAPAEFVKIIATVYDAQGQVAGTGFAFSSLDTIPAGGKSPFEISLEKRDNFARYELQVQGN